MTSNKVNGLRVERVDDIPVVYGLLERMGIQEAIDSLIKPHGNSTGLSPGWVITVWLMHILSEQNHLMEPVQQWVGRHLYTLTQLSKQPLRELDFTDDRLAICLRDLSEVSVWHELERQVGLRLIRALAWQDALHHPFLCPTRGPCPRSHPSIELGYSGTGFG